MWRNIALYGRSGSGKSTVAQELVRAGYQHLKTGRACRDLCNDFFQDESKTTLNLVTDALRKIDSTVWLRAAMRDVAADVPIVFDSMRFPEDHEYFKDKGYLLISLQTSEEVRLSRLVQRGQSYDRQLDDQHAAEVSIMDFDFDFRLDTTPAIHELMPKILEIAQSS